MKGRPKPGGYEQAIKDMFDIRAAQLGEKDGVVYVPKTQPESPSPAPMPMEPIVVPEKVPVKVR